MRTMTASVAALAVVLMIGLPTAFAADKPKDLIVGKWEPEKKMGMGFVIEFKKDGKLAVTAKGDTKDVNIEGTYKFVSDDSLEVSLEESGQKKTETIKVTKIDKDGMTVVDGMGKEEKFKRLK